MGRRLGGGLSGCCGEWRCKSIGVNGDAVALTWRMFGWRYRSVHNPQGVEGAMYVKAEGARSYPILVTNMIYSSL